MARNRARALLNWFTQGPVPGWVQGETEGRAGDASGQEKKRRLRVLMVTTGSAQLPTPSLLPWQAGHPQPGLRLLHRDSRPTGPTLRTHTSPNRVRVRWLSIFPATLYSYTLYEIAGANHRFAE